MKALISSFHCLIVGKIQNFTRWCAEVLKFCCFWWWWWWRRRWCSYMCDQWKLFLLVRESCWEKLKGNGNEAQLETAVGGWVCVCVRGGAVGGGDMQRKICDVSPAQIREKWSWKTSDKTSVRGVMNGGVFRMLHNSVGGNSPRQNHRKFRGAAVKRSKCPQNALLQLNLSCPQASLYKNAAAYKDRASKKGKHGRVMWCKEVRWARTHTRIFVSLLCDYLLPRWSNFLHPDSIF